MTTCLVIDESSIVIKVATRILDGLGVATAGAGSLTEAEAMLVPGVPLPDLIILSASLTDTPVETVLRALRAKTGGGEPAILVSLVDANLGLMTRSKRAGASGFIFRPFDRASLTAWVDAYIKVAA